MAAKFMQLVLTPAVQAAQERYFGKHQTVAGAPARDPFTGDEAAFIASRDSRYMATVNLPPASWRAARIAESAAPFTGSVSPVSRATASSSATAIWTGTTGFRSSSWLVLRTPPHGLPAMRGKTERLFLIEAVSHDWNCPPSITPRFTEAETEAETEAHTVPRKARIAELAALAATHKG